MWMDFPIGKYTKHMQCECIHRLLLDNYKITCVPVDQEDSRKLVVINVPTKCCSDTCTQVSHCSEATKDQIHVHKVSIV